MKSRIIALACASLIGAAAHAVTVYSDDFDGNTVGLNKVPADWAVGNGTVDVIGNGFFGFYPGNGAYIDLDDPSRGAGALSTTGLYTLAIANRSGDNIGAMLTSVQVSAVPEPGNWALSLAGLAALGLVARRRKPAR